MPTTAQTYSLTVTQQAYDDGYRVFYCTFCPNTVYGDVDPVLDMRCLSCLPVPVDPEVNPPTLQYRPMATADWVAATTEFVWSKDVGGSTITPAAPPVP